MLLSFFARCHASWPHLLLSTCLLLSAGAANARPTDGLPAASVGVDGGAARLAQLATSMGAAIEAARSSLEGADLSTAQRSTAKTLLDTAAAADKESDGFVPRLASLRKQQSATPESPPAPLEAADIQSRLETWSKRIPADADNDTLERLLTQERNAQSELKTRIDQTTQELTTLISSPVQTQDRIYTLRRRANDTQTPAAKVDGEPAVLTEARQLQQAATHRRAAIELAVLELEQGTSDIRQRQLETSLQILWQELAVRKPRIDWLTRRIAETSQQQLQALAQQMRDLAADQPSADSRVALLAQQNADLANELLQQMGALDGDRDELLEAERSRDTVVTALRDTQARLRLGSGSNAAIGHWLWQQHMALPSAYALGLRRRGVESNLGSLRLRLYNLTEQRYSLTHAQPAPEDASGNSADAADAQNLAQWQATQMALLDQLDPLVRRRINTLEQTDAALGTIINQGTELRQLMERQLLWMPSHVPVSQQWLQQLPASLLQSLQPQGIRQMPQLLGTDIYLSPVPWLLALVLAAALFALAWRAPAALKRMAARMQDPARDSFAHTFAALLWTLALALPWPALAWLAGYLLQHASGSGEAWGSALKNLGDILLPLCLLHALLAPQGLAQNHLYWPPERLRLAHRLWLPALLLLVPSVLLALVPLYHDVDAAIDGQTRLVLMLLPLALAVLSIWLLRQPPQGAPGRHPRLQRGLLWLLSLAFVFCSVIAGAGYVFTSVTVLDALFKSLFVGLVVVLAAGLLQRWLLLGERRLQMKQRAQQAEADGALRVRDVESGDTDDSDETLPLVTVSAQSHRLVRLLLAVLLLGGMAWAWSYVLPALLKFDSVVLWYSTTTDTDGKIVRQPVSLMAVGVSLLVLALTFSVGRNLPGLLEILLTPYQRMSAASRYTLTTLLRYGIVIAGSLIGLGMLGLRWSQLQWMAAALTVGLGFGMQEIFANFVSGLILLVERPFRVGDTITIGELNGTVTRIRTRATTVRDYDNKEVIIPNKAFITGQITNWSLTDTVTRIVLPVGVAYGTDLARAQQLLAQVAASNPCVMKEPAPTVAIVALADSSINFELRAFVPDLSDRIPATNALFQSIVQQFAEAGIEISFPQMDLHLRDWPANLPQPAATPPDAAGAAAAGQAGITGQTS